MGKKYKKGFDWFGHNLPQPNQCEMPREMQLCDKSNSGVFFGLAHGELYEGSVGMRQGEDGHIIIFGGSGSGKSVGIAKPTQITWRGAMVVTDVKGELSDYYLSTYSNGDVTRPPIIFDPTDPKSIGYDPFELILSDDECNLIGNVMEIAFCLIPTIPEDNQPFWADSERFILAAALLYFFKLEMSFSETILMIVSKPLSELNEEILHSRNETAKLLLGNLSYDKPELLANFEAGLRSKLLVFATDPHISHAFRGKREGAPCFSWDDLDTHNIFLRIPEHRIEQWGAAINLIYTQLIHRLERRPDKYSADGNKNIQTLLLMDEFARFGKLNVIRHALSTLRSKNVNICLIVQSLAQLDAIYGERERRIILDNCSFKVILQANDAETQHYFSELIGTTIVSRKSYSEHQDVACDVDGYSTQENEAREYRIFPHELAYLKDELILSPYGFFRAQKVSYDFMPPKRRLPIRCTAQAISIVPASICVAESDPNTIALKATVISSCKYIEQPILFQEGETKMLTTEERIRHTRERADKLALKDRESCRQEQEAQRKANQRRNYIIGELVTKYFPELMALALGTEEENAVTFKSFEALLYVLANNRDVLLNLKENASQIVSQIPEEDWRNAAKLPNV